MLGSAMIWTRKTAASLLFAPLGAVSFLKGRILVVLGLFCLSLLLRESLFQFLKLGLDCSHSALPSQAYLLLRFRARLFEIDLAYRICCLVNLSDGAEIKLIASEDIFQSITPGQSGILTWEGENFLVFERKEQL